MNIYIFLFLLCGACFGLLTFEQRHLFSEGPSQASVAGQAADRSARLLWVLVCTFLWPLMALAGINSARILYQRKRRQ